MKANELPAVAYGSHNLLAVETIVCDIRSEAAYRRIPQPSFEISTPRGRIEWAIISNVAMWMRSAVDATAAVHQLLVEIGYDVHGLEDGRIAVCRVSATPRVEAPAVVESKTTTYRASTAFGSRDALTVDQAIGHTAWMLDRSRDSVKIVEVTAALWHVHMDGERVGTIVKI
jgi:hypothetical protein